MSRYLIVATVSMALGMVVGWMTLIASLEDGDVVSHVR